MNKGSLKNKWKKWVLILIVITGIFIYFNRRSSLNALVSKVEVRDREVRNTISASGMVISDQQVDLAFMASGRILKINVSENESVKKGQLIAYINSSAQSQTVQSYKDARDIRLRQKDLFEEEKSANKKLLGGQDSYDIKLREYEEMVSQAEATYQAQLSLLSNYYIYAPFDGTIIEINSKEGEISTTGVPIVKVADLDDIFFEVILDQEDYGSIKVGQIVEIEIDAYKDDVFSGVVEMLPLYSNPIDGGFKVKVGFEKNGKLIKIGMTGDVYMITDTTGDEIQSLIFNEFSYDDEGDPFVWIVEDGKLSRLPIELGLEGDLYTEIKTDLSGFMVVVPANENLTIKEGFKAKFIN